MKKPACLALAALFCAAAYSQTTPAGPSFEVATIKPAPPLNPALVAQGKVHLGMKIDAARVDIGFLSIADLIRLAYEVKPYQVSGPEWINTERFDILAKMPEGATKEQVPAMLKNLLADRFKLVVHKENKDHPVYALVAGKGGPKLKEAAPDASAPPADAPAPKGSMTVETNEGTMRISRDPKGPGAVISNSKGGTMSVTMGQDGMMHMEMSKMNMTAFADALSRYVDRPVIDQTGLKGDYQMSLDISMQDMLRIAKSAGVLPAGVPPGALGAGAADAASDPGSSSVFAAVQRLGLKLEPRKEPVETIVVDHVEKTPTEN